MWSVVSIHLSVDLSGKNFNFGHYTQIFQPDSFISAMLKGIIHLHHVTPASGTLTLAGGHKASISQNLLASFSNTLFNIKHGISCHLKLAEHPDAMFKKIFGIKGNKFCFTDCVQKPLMLACIQFRMIMNQFGSDLA